MTREQMRAYIAANSTNVATDKASALGMLLANAQRSIGSAICNASDAVIDAAEGVALGYTFQRIKQMKGE